MKKWMIFLLLLISVAARSQVRYGYGPTLSPQTIKFCTAAKIYDMTEIIKIDDFVRGCQQDGTWDKLLAFYPFSGTTFDQHKYNLVDTSTFKLIMSRSGSYSYGKPCDHTGGVQWGSGFYFKTGLIPSTYFTGTYSGKMSLGIYVNKLGALTTQSQEIGASNTTPSAGYTALALQNDAQRFTSYLSTAKLATSDTVPYANKVYIVARTSLSNNSAYMDGILQKSNTSATTESLTTSNVELYIGGTNTSGSISGPTTTDINCAFVGYDLNATQVYNLTRRIKSLKTASSNPFWADSNQIFRQFYYPGSLTKNLMVLNHNNNYVVAMSDDNSILYSSDYGETWSDSTTALVNDTVQACSVFKDGEVMLFTTKNKIYRSSDHLHTLSLVKHYTMTRDTLPLQNPTGKGIYQILERPHLTILPYYGEVSIFSTYTNSEPDYAPVVITMCTKDSVFTIYRNGIFNGRGDATNPLSTKHIHAVAINPSNNDLYALGGDFGSAIMILKGVYDAPTRKYNWTKLTDGSVNYHCKLGDAAIARDTLYAASDVTDWSAAFYDGIWKVALQDIADSSKWRRIHYLAPADLTAIEYLGDGKFIAQSASSVASGVKYIMSTDYGATWKNKGMDSFTGDKVYTVFGVNDKGYCIVRGLWSLERKIKTAYVKLR